MTDIVLGLTPTSHEFAPDVTEPKISPSAHAEGTKSPIARLTTLPVAMFMTRSVAEQVAKLSQAFELFPGNLIYSGTPENVGPVVPGDVMQGSIAGLPTLDVRVV